MELLNAGNCRSSAPAAGTRAEAAANDSYRRCTTVIEDGSAERSSAPSTVENRHAIMRKMAVQAAGSCAAGHGASGSREGDEKLNRLGGGGGGNGREEVQQGGGSSRMGGSTSVRQWRSGSAATSAAAVPCQDCGNQAKKDCAHVRCRTCCKSRGFECATHIRSTWVPAAKRRERQQSELAAIVSGNLHRHHHHHHHHTLLQFRSKRTRSAFAAAAGATPLPLPLPMPTSSNYGGDSAVLDIQPGGQASGVVGLPPEIKTQAVFQCVKVATLGGGGGAEAAEYAYRAVARIGGRIFKGLLHDQGCELVVQQVPSSSSNMTANRNNIIIHPPPPPPPEQQLLPISSGSLINVAGTTTSLYGMVPAAAVAANVNCFMQPPF